MIRLTVIPLLLMTLLIGCKSEPTRDSVAQQSTATMEELVGTLKSVTDEASANAAKPKVRELSARFHELRKQEKQLGEATKEQQDELKKYEERNAKALQEMLSETKRLKSDPKLSSVLDEMKLNEPLAQ